MTLRSAFNGFCLNATNMKCHLAPIKAANTLSLARTRVRAIPPCQCSFQTHLLYFLFTWVSFKRSFCFFFISKQTRFCRFSPHAVFSFSLYFLNSRSRLRFCGGRFKYLLRSILAANSKLCVKKNKMKKKKNLRFLL